MSLMSWFRSKPKAAEGDPKFAHALFLTHEVEQIARALRFRLEPFRIARDPFVAMWAEAYEREQEKNIYLGPLRHTG